MELQFSQNQHQGTPVPSTDKVFYVLKNTNVDHLGRRHEYTGGFPNEVSAPDTLCIMVGSRLQCRSASTIWFVNHWWHLTSSTLISVWPRCTPGQWSTRLTSTWCCASDGGYLRRQKGNWPAEAGEDRRVALATSGSTRFRWMPTRYCCLRCGDLRSPGVTERCNGSLGLRDDNDDDDDDEGCKTCVKKWREKASVSALPWCLTVGMLTVVCFTVICFYLHCVQLWIK